MKRQLVFISVLSLLGLSGCATTQQMTPDYVSPSQYQGYDCHALQQELNRIHGYIKQAQKQQSTLTATGVGVGVSAGRWGISPSISVGIGKSNATSARDKKLSRLHGERDAVVQSARIHSCQFASGLKLYGE